jgi:hypothetical protein
MARSRKGKHPVADTVTALFSDSTIRFKLPANATLEDLAERLAQWGEGHGGLPLYVGVTFRPTGAASLGNFAV